MRPWKRPSSVADGGARDEQKVSSDAVVVTSASDDALALAQEAEAEAAEAAAEAERASARALKLRRQAEAAAAKAVPPVALDVPEQMIQHDIASTATEYDESKRRRRLKLPRTGPKGVAAALIVLCTVGFLGASAFMWWSHRQVTEAQQRSESFAAAGRQDVVTLMSLNFNNAKDDVQHIVDDATGDFKQDFQGQSDAFIKAAQASQVITTATVNAAAVQSMTKDTATVLVAVTAQVSNAASKQQEPRSWRLRVDVTRDGAGLKLAKVEFVP
jgi:Mce-associated membrane protein